MHGFGGRTKSVEELLGKEYPLKVYSGAQNPLLRQPRHDPEIHGHDGLGGVEGLLDGNDPDVKKFMNKESDTYQSPLLSVVEHIKKAVYFCRERSLGDLTLISTGGMTNIAMFILSYPSLIGLGKGVKEIVLVGGAVGIGNRGPTSEFNVLFDPEAAKIVCDCRCKVVMVPLNVSHRAIWHRHLHSFMINPKSYLNSVQTNDANDALDLQPLTPLRHTLSTLFNFFKESYRTTFGFEQGPPIHDALCLLYCFNNHLFETKLYKVEIECQSRWCDGTTVVDVWGDRDNEFVEQGRENEWSGPKGKNVFVAQSANLTQCWTILLKAIHDADLVSPLNSSRQSGSSNLDWLQPPLHVVNQER